MYASLWALTLGLWPGCSAPPASPVQPRQPPPYARFTARGRWEHPTRLTYLVLAAGGPFSPERLELAVSDALGPWEATGVVAFTRAGQDELPSFTISWHGDGSVPAGCRPFGRNRSVAHTGPVKLGTFLHLDSTHGWATDGGPGESLQRTLRHELGHILGLDHCADPSALLAPGTQADEPTESDLAGLHSLYGGYYDGPGDIAIFRAGTQGQESIAPSLRRVAPHDVTDWRLLDTDADGDDELLVWRTDAAGLGALMIYHFSPGPLLHHTLGPVLGAAPPEAVTSFRLGVSGERWIVTRYQDGLVRLRKFNTSGWLAEATPEEHLAFDLDATTPAPAPVAHASRDTAGLSGDLDGDGLIELLVRSGGRH
jgi:hypothetical protein